MHAIEKQLVEHDKRVAEEVIRMLSTQVQVLRELLTQAAERIRTLEEERLPKEATGPVPTEAG